MTTIEVEEVDSVATPAQGAGRERRARDASSASATISKASWRRSRRATRRASPAARLYEAVIDALKEIYDPEIPVNIYELGLIYGVEVTDEGQPRSTMTLTTPHCPVAESMPAEVELRVGAVPGVGYCRRQSGLGSAMGPAEDVRRGEARTGDAVMATDRIRATPRRAQPDRRAPRRASPT